MSLQTVAFVQNLRYTDVDIIYLRYFMKNLFGKLVVVLTLVVGFSSCMKDDYDSWNEEQAKQAELERKRIDSTLNAQASLLEEYAAANFENEPIQSDSTGIWYEILEVGDADSYTYTNAYPTITVKYIGRTISSSEEGEIFEDKTTDEFPNGVTFSSSNWPNLINSWFYAFFPETITIDGTTFKTGGLTTTGLKKGSKIRFVSPSPYCYDNKSSEKIPADSPLDFTIEVIDIK